MGTKDKEINMNTQTPPITFHVGDLVDWSPEIQEAFDHPIPEFPLVEDHPRRKYGSGPFRVVQVETIPAGLLACGCYQGDPNHELCQDFDGYDRAEGKRVGDSDQTMRDAAGHHQWVWIEIGQDHAEQLTGAFFVVMGPGQQQTDTPADDGFMYVQFCPCGHVIRMHRDEVIRLGGANQLDLIGSGKKLDAPTFHQSDCPDCQDERDRRARHESDYWPEEDWDDGSRVDLPYEGSTEFRDEEGSCYALEDGPWDEGTVHPLRELLRIGGYTVDDDAAVVAEQQAFEQRQAAREAAMDAAEARGNWETVAHLSPCR
jgi:hypothetical protein